MREILFRGKTADGKWVEGFYTKGFRKKDAEELEDMIYMFLGDSGKWSFDYALVIPETVGQYTGLTDKNGTKIFEGDIIKHHQTLWGEDISDIGLILWCERTCKFYRTSKRDTVGSFEIWEETAERYEVIGNIHDNPELLEEQG